ncbi:MAG: hypothetical protein IJ646_07280 [Clostridia bacterium]|nr:hypothetical protein [Clostridia bacterium]
MLEQRVENPAPSGLKGVALIALVAAAVLAGSNFFYFIGQWIGTASSILFLLYGALVAWLLLDRYVLKFIYTCDGNCLRVCRAYGNRERFMADVWLNGVQACGTLDDMRRRFPGAKVQRATKRECPLEPLAVAYNDAGRTAIMVLQPNEELRKIIVKAVKR